MVTNTSSSANWMVGNAIIICASGLLQLLANTGCLFQWNQPG